MNTFFTLWILEKLGKTPGQSEVEEYRMPIQEVKKVIQEVNIKNKNFERELSKRSPICSIKDIKIIVTTSI